MYKSAIIVGSALLSVASAFEGDGTFYGAGGNGAQGACMMQPGSTGIGVTVAMNDAQYPGSCGKCVRITGDGRGTGGPGSTPVFGPVYAVVDNHCPECKYGDVDFGLAGDGRWRIAWDWVSCDEARHAQSNVPQPINYGVNTWGLGNQAGPGNSQPPQGQPQGQGRQGGWWGWWQQLSKTMGERLHLRGTKPAPTNLAAADSEYRPRAEPPMEPLVLKPGFMVMKDGSFKKIAEVTEGMEQEGKAHGQN